MSSDSDDLKGKFSNEEEDFSDDQKNKEKVSIEKVVSQAAENLLVAIALCTGSPTNK